LTVLGVAVTIFVLVAMVSITTVMGAWEDHAAGSRRVVVMHRSGFDVGLPLAMQTYLESRPAVVAVKETQWFGGVWNDPKEFFPCFVSEMEHFPAVWPEVKIPPDQWRDLLADKTGCLVGARLAKRHGWKLGDRVTLRGTIYPVNPELTVRALYTDMWDQNAHFYFHYSYFADLAGEAARPGWFWVVCRSREEIPQFIAGVEAYYADSPHPVRVMPEQEFVRIFASMLGNVKVLVENLGYILVGMLLLATGSTMVMAVQERRREVAVMKALGFTPRMILGLVSMEGIGVALIGARLGVAGAFLVFDVWEVGATAQWGKLNVYLGTLVHALVVAGGVGLASGFLPGLWIVRVPVAQGLRSVE
jgi:putative ABC transport system permease protein